MFLVQRYQRQMLLPRWGESGQAAIAAAHVVIVGIGALGCVSAELLARAGVGHLTLIDRDLVDMSNLHRQILFSEADAREQFPKAAAAARRLAEINSSIRIDPVIADVTGSTVEELIPSDVAAIVDGTDNFQTRYLMNDLSVKRGIPYCYAGVVGTHAAQGTFQNQKPESACLRCIFPDAPAPGSTPTCDSVGVLPPAVMIVGGAQAADVLKILLGASDLLSDSILEFDSWSNQRRRLSLKGLKDPECPCCGARRFEWLDAAEEGSTSLCGSLAVQIQGRRGEQLDLPSLATSLARFGSIKQTPYFLQLEVREQPAGFAGPLTVTLFRDGRAILRGTERPELARAAYARLIGT